MAAPAGFDAFFGTILRHWGMQRTFAESLALFALGLARWLPIVMICPFLGGRLVPTPVKMGLSSLFAVWLVPWLGHQAPPYPTLGSIGYAFLLLKEIFVGLAIGFGASLLFWAAEMGGRFLDNIRGTTAANVLLPQFPVSTSLLGDFYFQLFIVLYLLLGGHRWFLDAVFRSYQWMPPFSMNFHLGLSSDAFIAGSAALFEILLKIIAPALVVLILMDLILGVANRMAPQLDVFFLSLSLKAAVGALAVALSLYSLIHLMPALVRASHGWLESLMQSLLEGN